MTSSAAQEDLVRIFVDTNCFLHLRDLKDLPWRSIFPRLKTLEIVVAHVVTDELDRLKTDKTGRLRDRARSALSLIEQTSCEPGMRISLRAAPFEIWFVLDQSPPVDWSAYPRLNSTWPDDQLLAAALSDAGRPTPILLSHDTGPLIRARALGLAALRTPDDWELPPQADKLVQDNARLVRELAAARSTQLPTV